MDASEALVILFGAAAIAAVLWYFFGERTRVQATLNGGIQRVGITVKGGYSPDVVVVKSGRPVRLDFYRDETDSCSEEIVLGEFGIFKRLPPYQITSVQFTPEDPGEYVYACGMGMLRGKLVVEP